MRALCEACGKPQPPDWTPGGQCVHCGKAVRRELRCFWCVKWTPAAKFCRSCGAETVEARVFGAARMLKDAGTDRFTVPKQLRDFDPEQVENFTRIYQRHAIAVARHVDDVRFLERFLRQKAWSDALEDQLIPQLPWPEETLARMSAPPPQPGDDLSTARALAKDSPFPTTRALATLVRLRLDDWSAHKDACSVFYTQEPALKAEAALTLTSWRVLYGVGRPREQGRELYDELKRSTFKLEAAVRLASLGTTDEGLLKEALTSNDPETSFGAALVLGDVDRLQAALKGGELEKSAAGSRLIQLGVIKPVVETIEKSPIEIQRELVESLVRRKGPAPEAAETLLEIVETTSDDSLRERAVRVLCRQLRPAWIVRIVKAGKGDAHIFQSLLQAEGLEPASAVELGDHLLRAGRFASHQYGLNGLAEKGLMPATFVPSRFGAADDKTRLEMLRFAELQLAHGGDEALHAFVMGVVWGKFSAKVRAGAWWALHRWYKSLGEYRGEGPFKLEKALIEKFFGTVAAFGTKLAAVLRDHDTLKEVGYYEMIANVLPTADEEAVDALRSPELIDALLDAMKGDYWPNTLEGMIKLVARLGADERWRSKVLGALRALGKKGNYHYDKALRNLELSEFGLPDENAWKDLPPDFVPSRWEKATPAGRAELLKVADQQLIYDHGDGLGPFLLKVALAGNPEAMDIYEDRIRENVGLHRDACAYYSELVAVLPIALRETEDPKTHRFLQNLFRDPRPTDVDEIAAEGEAGRALIDAMLERAAMKGDLSERVIRHLAVSGTHPSWREKVRAALQRLGSEGERALRQFPPPEVKTTPASLAKEHQEKIFRLMAGPGTLDHKKREAARLKAEYEAKLKAL
ncbi:MAG TPA: hypothetical protein VF950_04615 [Planctomycetota bacterium]